MRLTKKKAIEISKELWGWLAESGEENKRKWSGWERYGYMVNSCPLCEYGEHKAKANGAACDHCPYCLKFDGCCENESPYDNWDFAETKAKRQKYAKEFLEQLNQL